MRFSVRLANPALAAVFLSALLLAACASPAQRDAPAASAPMQADAAQAWRADVSAIAAAKDNAGRRAAIESALAASGIQARRVPFAFEKHKGTNLLADI